MGFKITDLSESSMAVKRRPEGRSAGRCRIRGGRVALGQSVGPPRATASRYAPRKSRQVVRATFFAILSSFAICRYGRAALHGVHARSESVRSLGDIEGDEPQYPSTARRPVSSDQATAFGVPTLRRSAAARSRARRRCRMARRRFEPAAASLPATAHHRPYRSRDVSPPAYSRVSPTGGRGVPSHRLAVRGGVGAAATPTGARTRAAVDAGRRPWYQ